MNITSFRYSDPYTLVFRIQELVKRLIDESINMMRDIPQNYSAEDMIAPPQPSSSTLGCRESEVDDLLTKDGAATTRETNSYRVGDDDNKDEDDFDDGEDEEEEPANGGEEAPLIGVSDEQESSCNLSASANVTTQVSSQGCSRVFIVKGKEVVVVVTHVVLPLSS